MTNITTEQPWEDGRVNRTTVLVDDRESRSWVLGHCHAVPGEENHDDNDVEHNG